MSLPKAGVQLVAQDAAAFQSALGDASRAVTDFGQAADRAGSGVSSVGQVMTGALRHMGTIAVDAAVEGARAIGGFVADSISQAGDFEKGMGRFSATVGDSLADAGMEVGDFSKLFLQLGADTQFSAGEAQDAAIALAKGGISPLEIASGALADTLTLAAAGELELANAAEITAKQLGVWAREGVTSAQVADLLAQAANASTVDVGELADGMANAAGRAQALGVDYKDFATTMALIAPGFSSAQEAGSSYNNFLARLQPTTKDQVKTFKELNLITKDGRNAFFDSTGAFIGNRDAAELLKKTLSGMTDQRRGEILQTLFGNDAMGAANMLMQEGAAGYDVMTGKMTAAGTAAEQAAEKNKGFDAAMSALSGSVDTLKVVLGTALLPVLTSLINDYLIPGVNAVMNFAQGIFGAADPMAALVLAIDGLLPGFAGFVGFMQNALTAAQPLIALIGANLVPILGAVATVLGAGLLVALGGVVAGFLAVAAPIGIAIGALALLYANIGPIKDGLAAFGNTEWGQAIQRGAQIAKDYFTGPFVGELTAGIGVVQGKFGELAASPWGQDVQRGAQVVVDYFAGPFASELAGGVGVVQGKLNELAASEWGQAIQRGAGVAKDYFTGPFVGEFTAGVGVVVGKFGELQSAVSPWVEAFQRGVGIAQARFAELGAFFANDFPAQFARGTARAGELLTGMATAVGTWAATVNRGWTVVATAWNEWVATLGRGAEVVKTGLSAIATAVGTWATAVNKGWAVVTTAWNAWTTALGTGVEAIKTGLSAALTAISGWVTEVNKGWTAITTAWQGFAKSASSLGTAVIDGITSGITAGVGALTSAVSAAAQSALQSAKETLGISSPSREAAEQVGTPFVLGIVQGIEDSTDLLTDMARQLSEQLVDDMALVGEAAAEAFREMFTSGLEGTASIARQKAKNLRDTQKIEKAATKEEDPYKRGQLQMIAGSAQKQLGDAEAFAATFADPKLGAKYFKEESARIVELAELKQQYIQATTNEEKAALTQQMRLIEEAQAAEKALFQATAAEQSKTFSKTAESLQTVLDKLRHEAERDLGISKLDIGKENQASAYAEYLKDIEAIKQVEALYATLSSPVRPVASAGQIAQSGTVNNSDTRNYYYAPTYGAAPRAPQMDFAIMQALANV